MDRHKALTFPGQMSICNDGILSFNPSLLGASCLVKMKEERYIVEGVEEEQDALSEDSSLRRQT